MTKRPVDSPVQRTAGGSLVRTFDRLPELTRDLLCALVMLLVVYAIFWGVIVHDRPFGLSGDTEAAFQWKRALDHIRETEQVEPLWMPYLYGGMPVFGSLLFPREVNYIEHAALAVLGKPLFLFSDAHYILLHVFLAGLFMYMLARSLRFSPLVSLLAGLVFMMNPYAIGLWESFHWSKLATWSFTPLLFLLTYNLFQRRNLLSFGLLAAAVGTMFLNRHPQMAFYGMLAVGAYFLYESALSLRKEPVRVFWNGLLLGGAVLLGLAIYSYEMLPTREYAEYSVRGGGSENPGGGANYDWATGWSLHPLELMNYVVPSFFGFSSQVMSEWQGRPTALPLYWGWMPFTDNPPYIGIIPVVLSVLALVHRRNRLTWFLAGFSALVFFLSFGNFFPLVYDLFFHYFPYFNKFRAPSLVLYLIPFTLGLLGLYGLSWVIETGRSGTRDPRVDAAARGFGRWLIGIAAAIVLVLIGNGVLREMMIGSMFERAGESQQYGRQVVEIFKEKRFDLLWQDLLRVLAITGVMFWLMRLFLRRRLSESAMVLGVCALLFADLYTIDVKFITTRPREEISGLLEPDATIGFLTSDTSVFRVLSIEQGMRPAMNNDLMNSQIQSVTGYSPAKLRIYQEMLDSALFRSIDGTMPFNMNVAAMLNTRYLVSPVPLPPDRFVQRFVDPETRLATYEFTGALGRAWIVDSVVVAPTRSETYAVMNDPAWNPAAAAVLNAPAPVTDPDSAWVRVESYRSSRIILRAYASSPALLVLSDVYYPAGWTAAVDGEPVEIRRTNSILRSVVVPAGEHDVVFTFDPETYRLGSAITTAGWAVTFLVIGIGLVRDGGVRRWFTKRSGGAGERGETTKGR